MSVTLQSKTSKKVDIKTNRRQLVVDLQKTSNTTLPNGKPRSSKPSPHGPSKTSASTARPSTTSSAAKPSTGNDSPSESQPNSPTKARLHCPPQDIRVIDSTGVFGGVPEHEFRRILGVDGWRAHLNHFYGVHIEQCLIAAVQSVSKNDDTPQENHPPIMLPTRCSSASTKRPSKTCGKNSPTKMPPACPI